MRTSPDPEKAAATLARPYASRLPIALRGILTESVKKVVRNSGAVIAGRVVPHNASSAAALGHLAAVHKRWVGCKKGAAT
jgi:hypothetical protein